MTAQGMYDFQNTIAIKLLIKKEEKVFLVREPESNDWMPGRLGLPGGKPLLHELLIDTITRKIQTEVGLEVEVRGIVKLVDIIMPQKTVYHIVLAAEYVSGEIDTAAIESNDAAWYTEKQLAVMANDEFTEYYNHTLITNYLNNQLTTVPLDFLLAQDNRQGDVASWMQKGALLS